MDTPAQQSHTHLYIIVGIVIVFALVFFIVKTPVGEKGAMSIPEDTTPLELKRLVLTAEEAMAKEKAFEDPRLTERLKLTQAELAAKKKALEDPRMTARITN